MKHDLEFNTEKILLPSDDGLKFKDIIVWSDKFIKTKYIEIDYSLAYDDDEFSIDPKKLEGALQLSEVQNGKHGNLIECLPDVGLSKHPSGIFQIIEDVNGKKSIINLDQHPFDDDDSIYNPIGRVSPGYYYNNILVSDFLKNLIISKDWYHDDYNYFTDLKFYIQNESPKTFRVNLGSTKKLTNDSDIQKKYNEMLLQLHLMNMYKNCFLYYDRNEQGGHNNFLIYTSIPNKDHGLLIIDFSMEYISTYIKKENIKNLKLITNRMEKNNRGIPDELKREIFKYF